MDLCVVIAARNEERWLTDQLDALLSQHWDGEWEVVVVDNGSTDGTADLVEGYASANPRVRLLRADEVAGKTYAMNRAAEATGARAIAFTDADDIVAEGWLEAIAAGVSEHPVVTGPNELDRLNPEWLAASRGRGIEAQLGSFFGFFPTVRGNNFAVRRSIWQQLDGMTEGLFPCEDLDFSMRCWLHGVPIVGLPNAVVHYRYRQSNRALWKQGFAYGSHRPLIAKTLKKAHKPTPPRFAGWKSWIMLITTLPRVVTRTGRARWLWIAGNRFGQVAGSIRYRTLML